jgi:hypothetical protein
MLCSAPKSVASLSLWITEQNFGRLWPAFAAKDPAARGWRDGRPCSFVDPTSADVVIVGAVQEIKTNSSRWMGKSFAWQCGFAAFSVSASNKDAVVRYIRTQDAHHKKMDYKSELIALLKKHGVAYDPKSIFD